MCHGHRHSREYLFSGGHGCQGVQGVRGTDAPARPLLTHGTEKDGSGAPTVRDDRGWGDGILSTVARMFTPLMPAIAAAGLVKGVLTAVSLIFKQRGIDITTNDTYVLLYAAGQVIFYFLPIFLGYTAAKALRCNEIIAMVLGAFLRYPQVDKPIQDVGTATTIYGIPGVKATWTIGESTKVFSYTESVIPILLAFAGAANFAQGGAAPGVWLKTKSEEMRGVSLSVMISAVLVGITEPAIYGCNLRFKWLMACAIIAGAVGGAIMGFGNVFGDAFATNGVLTIFTYASFGIAQFVFYLVGCAVAFFGAAASAAVMGFEELTDEGMEV